MHGSEREPPGTEPLPSGQEHLPEALPVVPRMSILHMKLEGKRDEYRKRQELFRHNGWESNPDPFATFWWSDIIGKLLVINGVLDSREVRLADMVDLCRNDAQYASLLNPSEDGRIPLHNAYGIINQYISGARQL